VKKNAVWVSPRPKSGRLGTIDKAAAAIAMAAAFQRLQYAKG
jgi:hypothetical protein